VDGQLPSSLLCKYAYGITITRDRSQCKLLSFNKYIFVFIPAGGLVQLWWSTAARQAFQQQLLPTLLLPGEH
jgi:hypothetical protein